MTIALVLRDPLKAKCSHAESLQSLQTMSLLIVENQDLFFADLFQLNCPEALLLAFIFLCIQKTRRRQLHYSLCSVQTLSAKR